MTGQPPPRGFPEAEYLRRTEAAQEMMVDSGIGCLLVCTEPEVRYFTGFHTPFWQSPTRSWFVIVPTTGRPIAVIPAIGADSMSATWVDSILTWPAPQPDDDGISLLASALGDVVGPSGTVGIPMGHETHLRMPLNDYAALRARLGGVDFVDATQIVRSLRMVKSEAEIAKVAHICSIVSDSFAALPALVHVGMSEREAFRAFKVDLLQRGADDVPYLVGATGPGFADVIKQPGGRLIEHGDLLMFDTGSMFDGYSSDFDRYYAFGEADPGAEKAYRTVWEATEAGLEAMRPGATTSDAWTAMADVLTAGGSLGNSVGRLGHGLGMQVTEWPSNTADDGTEIVEGMVLTLEPGLTWEPGKLMLHEENVVIRSNGPELLSQRAQPILPVLT